MFTHSSSQLIAVQLFYSQFLQVLSWIMQLQCFDHSRLSKPGLNPNLIHTAIYSHICFPLFVPYSIPFMFLTILTSHLIRAIKITFYIIILRGAVTGMEMKMTKKLYQLPERSCKDRNCWYLVNMIKLGEFFSLLKTFHILPLSFFTPANAFKTFFEKLSF